MGRKHNIYGLTERGKLKVKTNSFRNLTETVLRALYAEGDMTVVGLTETTNIGKYDLWLILRNLVRDGYIQAVKPCR